MTTTHIVAFILLDWTGLIFNRLCGHSRAPLISTIHIYVYHSGRTICFACTICIVPAQVLSVSGYIHNLSLSTWLGLGALSL